LAFTLHMSRPGCGASSRKRRLSALAVALLAGLWSAQASADDASAPVTPRTPLRYDLWIDIPVTVGLGASAFVWSLVENDVFPRECLFCDGQPGHVNAVDDFFRTALRRSDVTPAKTASDIMGYGVAPVAAVGLGALAAGVDKRLDEAPLDTLLVAEATATSLALTEGLKSVLRRERPYVHFETDEDAHRALTQASDTLVSFPSGHTSTTFALAASAGTVATMRGYRVAPLVWIAGGMIAVSTGYLRMAADRHYFTDVVAGAALGTAVGVGIPLLFHRPVAPDASALAKWMHTASISSEPVPGGRVVSLGWVL
jgi:membrane-associated phospholipid phosphatase